MFLLYINDVADGKELIWWILLRVTERETPETEDDDYFPTKILKNKADRTMTFCQYIIT